MSRKTKIWLVVAASLVLVGCILFGAVMMTLNWDFRKLSTVKYGTSVHEVTTSYKNISIVTDTADIVFMPSATEQTSVVCYEQEKVKHSVTVKDENLVIAVQDTRKWYEHVGFSFDTPKITVTIPQGEYGALSVKTSTGDVTVPKEFSFENMNITESTGSVTNHASATGAMKIKTSTGNIRVENVSAGALELSVSTGKVMASNVTCDGDVTVNVSTGRANLVQVRCKNLKSNGNTGDLVLEDVVATEKISVKRSTGDVKLAGCDAGELFIKADTGHVKGSLLTEKIFIAQSDTGRVDVPKTTTGGRCEISTDTGDIQITIQP